jgi:hypothetical protein
VRHSISSALIFNLRKHGLILVSTCPDWNLIAGGIGPITQPALYLILFVWDLKWAAINNLIVLKHNLDIIFVCAYN